jgi:hypothetical protein
LRALASEAVTPDRLPVSREGAASRTAARVATSKLLYRRNERPDPEPTIPADQGAILPAEEAIPSRPSAPLIADPRCPPMRVTAGAALASVNDMFPYRLLRAGRETEVILEVHSAFCFAADPSRNLGAVPPALSGEAFERCCILPLLS